VLIQTGEPRYRHSDFRQNVQFVSDDNGYIVTLHEYRPYAVDVTLADPGDGVHFAGRQGIGGLMLLGTRVYDPLLGRFLSPDPVFSLLNQHTYTFGNPIWFSDRDGRISQEEWSVVGLMASAYGFALSAGSLVAGAATGGLAAVAVAGVFFSAVGFAASLGSIQGSGAGQVPGGTHPGLGKDGWIVIIEAVDPCSTGYQHPAGASPNVTGGNGEDSLVSFPRMGPGVLGGASGFGDVGSIGGSCGLLGVEILPFLWFTFASSRRRRKKRWGC
jgi:RHS repeat-associated protein